MGRLVPAKLLLQLAQSMGYTVELTTRNDQTFVYVQCGTMLAKFVNISNLHLFQAFISNPMARPMGGTIILLNK